MELLLKNEPRTVILDGALATKLESLGADLHDPLWSCKTLIEQPSLIQEVHRSYYNAGADIAITASYQASTTGLAEQRDMSEADAQALIRKSVELAQAARDEVLSTPIEAGRGLLVAGSVGPYGAYLADGSEYRGDYVVSRQAMQAFHRPRIQALVDANVDMLALETMPNFAEVEALLALLSSEFPHVRAWVSCTLRDGETMSDGTPLEALAAVVDDDPEIIAVGVNCVPKELVTPALRALRAETGKPLLCYPNSSEVWNAVHKTWGGIVDAQKSGWLDLVREWKEAGARMIGGCCRTGPEDIKAIRNACSHP